jgi:hypothetical protein
LFDFNLKPLKCSEDQIPSGGHSGEKRMERNQSIAANPDFHGMAVRFLCDDREMESDLREKVGGFGIGVKKSSRMWLVNIAEQFPSSGLDESAEAWE